MTILVIGGGKMGMSHLALATQYVGKGNVALCDGSVQMFGSNEFRTHLQFSGETNHLAFP